MTDPTKSNHEDPARWRFSPDIALHLPLLGIGFVSILGGAVARLPTLVLMLLLAIAMGVLICYTWSRLRRRQK